MVVSFHQQNNKKMGLHIKSLKRVPLNAEKDYYIYLLDYGWKEPLIDVLYKNFEKLSDLAEESDSVIVKGPRNSHFSDEVFAWHKINGEDAENLLPAILITNRHPARFKDMDTSTHIIMEIKNISDRHIENTTTPTIENNLKIILIPLKKFCSDSNEVLNLIKNLFEDITRHNDLSDFRIAHRVLKGGNAKADAIILEPNPNKNENPFDELIGFLKNTEDRRLLEVPEKSIRNLRDKLVLIDSQISQSIERGINEFETQNYVSSSRILFPAIEEITNKMLQEEGENPDSFRGLSDKLNKLERLGIIELDLVKAINVTERNKILHANYNPRDQELARPSSISALTNLSYLINELIYHSRIKKARS